MGLDVRLGLVGRVGFGKSGWVCFHWLILPCIALMLKLEFRVGWGGGVVQTDFRVKPTTKLLWVAFGLGCCCLAWLWGYDNKNKNKKRKVTENSGNCVPPLLRKRDRSFPCAPRQGSDDARANK